MKKPAKDFSKRRTSGRKALGILCGLALGAIALELLARRNARREQKKREPLGDTLYREVRGQGQPVLFIPGFQASTRYWDDAFDDLDGARKLIFVDCVGFGRSPWPDIEYTLDDHLGYIRRTMIEEAATSHVTIVAHSFGTILAAYYAQRFPGEVDRLILMGVPVFRSAAEARSRLWEMSPTAALFSLNPVLSHISCTLMCAFRPVLQKLVPLLRPDLDPAVASDGVLHMWSSVDRTLRHVLLGAPIEEALRGGVGAKTTIIHGRNDTVTPLSRIESLAAATGAELIVTDDEHHGYLEDGRDHLIRVIARRSVPRRSAEPSIRRG